DAALQRPRITTRLPLPCSSRAMPFSRASPGRRRASAESGIPGQLELIMAGAAYSLASLLMPVRSRQALVTPGIRLAAPLRLFLLHGCRAHAALAQCPLALVDHAAGWSLTGPT